MAFQIRCPNCGYEGNGVVAYSGSNVVGCLLFVLFIIPGLIYGLWQSSTRGAMCPQCGWRNVVITEGRIGTNPMTLIMLVIVVLVLAVFFLGYMVP